MWMNNIDSETKRQKQYNSIELHPSLLLPLTPDPISNLLLISRLCVILKKYLPYFELASL